MPRMKPVASERKEKTGGVAEWSVGGVQGDGRLEAQPEDSGYEPVYTYHDEKQSAPRTRRTNKSTHHRDATSRDETRAPQGATADIVESRRRRADLRSLRL